MLSTDISAKHTDSIDPSQTDGFKRLFAAAFVANNFNFLATKQQLSDGDTKFSRLSMVSDPECARYIREELSKRRTEYFFTAEDIAAGMYAIASDPQNSPEQRFPYYKVLAEATGLIGKGRQAADDTSPSAGVVIQIANYGKPDTADLPAAPYIDAQPPTRLPAGATSIDDVTKPKAVPAADKTPAITAGRARGKRLTPTDAEVDAMALAALPATKDT